MEALLQKTRDEPLNQHQCIAARALLGMTQDQLTSALGRRIAVSKLVEEICLGGRPSARRKQP
jgi:hypothetical protein